MRGSLLLLLAACDEGLEQRLAIIHEPRVLAIAAEPAEARPGAQVTYRALLAHSTGPLTGVPHWSFCMAPKPPTEDNAVSDGCFVADNLIDLGSTLEVTAALPTDGCLRFGPDTPPGGFRPRDPDATGGYYQPVRSDVDELTAFGLSRITCKLPTAPTEVAHDYDLHYLANTNPTLDPFELDVVPADTDLELTATWPPEAVENYLYYDSLSQRLVQRREAMRLSWFATGGSLEVDSNIVAETDLATSVSTTWHTPTTGEAWLWLVLRDSRGGVAWRQQRVDVDAAGAGRRR